MIVAITTTTPMAAALLVQHERVGLPVAAVERGHELGAEPFLQRVPAHELGQLGQQLGVPAQRQVGLDAALQRGDPRLFQPRRLGVRQVLGRAEPERQLDKHERALFGGSGGSYMDSQVLLLERVGLGK